MAPARNIAEQDSPPMAAGIAKIAPFTTSDRRMTVLPWPAAAALPDRFFDRDAQLLARALLGKVIRSVDELK